MTIIHETAARAESVKQAARRMMTAARTAPKGRGIDNLLICTAEGADLERMAEWMDKFAETNKTPFFARDAQCIRKSQCVVLIGVKSSPAGLPHCGLCGFADCAAKAAHPEILCTFNVTDLGIALGSAAATASDERVDSRIMFSAGLAARELGLAGEPAPLMYAIALSVSGKSPFFDRT